MSNYNIHSNFLVPSSSTRLNKSQSCVIAGTLHELYIWSRPSNFTNYFLKIILLFPSSFTAAGRLQCRIDAVAGCVVTGAGRGADADRSQLYQATIREGDLLLNRVKKLASVINF